MTLRPSCWGPPYFFLSLKQACVFMSDGKRHEQSGLVRQGASPSHLFISILLKIHISPQLQNYNSLTVYTIHMYSYKKGQSPCYLLIRFVLTSFFSLSHTFFRLCSSHQWLDAERGNPLISSYSRKSQFSASL